MYILTTWFPRPDFCAAWTGSRRWSRLRSQRVKLFDSYTILNNTNNGIGFIDSRGLQRFCFKMFNWDLTGWHCLPWQWGAEAVQVLNSKWPASAPGTNQDSLCPATPKCRQDSVDSLDNKNPEVKVGVLDCISYYDSIYTFVY